ncbi:non-reducing end alpha-L-arabinofuranosidase family hydrolase [Streptosporangium sp. NPDC005286]|uniref:non-reducing end alpha-L-arabinofuranosidase family hydrolase n=1 Tax=Streptosporangium sp. NPDC005286 TaxID=3154463 RepID=UPI0033A2E927
MLAITVFSGRHLTGYRAAPQVFYFAPQNLWCLVYQTGNASYSTTTDISNPASWSAPRHFYSGMPDIIRQNIGNGYWVDMWVTCDTVNCHLFSSDDNGHLYRSQTTVANFPNGFSLEARSAHPDQLHLLTPLRPHPRQYRQTHIVRSQRPDLRRVLTSRHAPVPSSVRRRDRALPAGKTPRKERPCP